ncbi:endoplasmic reticulum-Golgi intermediate compartment protein 2 [Chrysoperla carnea]|uniref:endoplasmic reticulum-Golgi intermediate compartment protein 2 n=1 Tax=Chrysoperla carnea TaxID=189513 RepID=UPI001D082390|nr:endoplasmic reticulum-Golgi intermediate compartment protein 2 [Chrysoperla carnea]
MRRRKVNITKIKEIDGFSKYEEGCVETSSTGGFFTIISVLLSLWLIYSELNYWLSSQFIFKLSVDDDPNAKLLINIDITVAMPCNSIGADILDSTNQNVFNFGTLEEENTYFELTPKQRRQFDSMVNINTYLREEYHAVQELLWRTNQPAMSFNPANYAKETIDKPFDACRLYGQLTLNKIAGNFHITAGKSLILPRGHIHINTFFQEDNYNFTHRINRLSFGDQSPGILHPLEGDEKFASEGMMLYQYFIEVVPTSVQTFFKQYNTYQYSVKEHTRPVDHEKGSHGIPGIFFKYDISPLKVTVRQERDNIFTFIVRLFATVGGIHTGIGMLNTLTHILWQPIFKNKKAGIVSDIKQ